MYSLSCNHTRREDKVIRTVLGNKNESFFLLLKYRRFLHFNRIDQ